MQNLPDDLLLCNCADCGEEMLGRSQLVWWDMLSRDKKRELPSMCAGRVDDRPYCKRCLRIKEWASNIGNIWFEEMK